MYKVYLALFFLFVSGKSIAQTNIVVLPDQGFGGGAINIAVSNLEEETGDSYFSEAEKNEKKGDLNEALTLFGKAAFEYNTSRAFASYGAALLRLSNIHLLLTHYTEAEQVILNVALKNYSRIGSRKGQMDSYNQLGKIYFSANKLTQSLWFYTQQGIIARQLKNNPAYIDSMLGIVSVKIKKKEYKLAAKDINKAELFARSVNVSQFNAQIKHTRNLISERVNFKK